ncbi:lipid IV(A) 3-deoxy-D-manno-octulosonic acid transferase [Vibrio ezurae]|uniref:lipid IV(A) 3-deoxy-D-manno-octulosonic acid transferase n=1 Tax=Vibrio ezurae TaxID=252583 RepID=UPI00059446DB|nr:lipid IV(A) 3-deoxy-D-manno-octulosonic acid transferase [Vibrio ezurae]
MIRILYNIALIILSPVLLYTLLKSKNGKPSVGSRWTEYFGSCSALVGKKPIWIHTVSVGETIAATPLIRAIKAKYPDQDILITTTTTTGAEQAAKLDDIAEHRFMPIDFSWCVSRFLKTANPKCMLIMETELWPNTLQAVANSNIPISVINARLSERSCQRYRQFQSVFNLISQNLDQILCQHQADAERFKSLGILPEKSSVTGSLKFDISIPNTVHENALTLRHQLGINRPVWVAASTHEGEDVILYDAHQKLLQAYPEALLILVPRHPERFEGVAKFGEEYGFNVVRRTHENKIDSTTQVYLGDTMGEMLTFISAADICFMAGSLIGDKVGGHNVLEPAALGKPILNGPSFFNFKEITHQLIKEQALVICHSADEINHQLVRLLSDSTLSEQMGENALKVVAQNQGAVAKTLEALSSVITKQ